MCTAQDIVTAILQSVMAERQAQEREDPKLRLLTSLELLLQHVLGGVQPLADSRLV